MFHDPLDRVVPMNVSCHQFYGALAMLDVETPIYRSQTGGGLSAVAT